MPTNDGLEDMVTDCVELVETVAEEQILGDEVGKAVDESVLATTVGEEETETVAVVLSDGDSMPETVDE